MKTAMILPSSYMGPELSAHDMADGCLAESVLSGEIGLRPALLEVFLEELENGSLIELGPAVLGTSCLPRVRVPTMSQPSSMVATPTSFPILSIVLLGA